MTENCHSRRRPQKTKKPNDSAYLRGLLQHQILGKLVRIKHTISLDHRGRVNLRIRAIVPAKREPPIGRVPNGELLLHTSGRTQREAVDAAMIAVLHELLRRADGEEHTCSLCEEGTS